MLTFAGQITETGSASYRPVHARNARPASWRVVRWLAVPNGWGAIRAEVQECRRRRSWPESCRRSFRVALRLAVLIGLDSGIEDLHWVPCWLRMSRALSRQPRRGSSRCVRSQRRPSGIAQLGPHRLAAPAAQPRGPVPDPAV